MSKNLLAYIAIAVLVIILIAGAFIFSDRRSPVSEAEVATTIFPIYDITRNITGDALEVALILPPGASPHTYEMTPGRLQQFTNTKVVYGVGHEFDLWSERISDSVGAEFFVVDNNIPLVAYEEREKHDHDSHDDHEDEHHDDEDHEDDHEDEDLDHHDHGDVDPHYWLTIQNGKIIATNIANDLTSRYPEHAETFATNLAGYLAELDQADAQIKETLSDLSTTELITLHDAWYYFAEEYGLEVVATFSPSPGREPTPRFLENLLEEIEEHELTVLYTEPQLAGGTIRGFARDNNVTLATLDPIGGLNEQDSYIGLMLSNAQIIQTNQ